MRILISIVVILLLIIFVLYLLKLYERRNVYFPTKTIFATPKDIGLDYEDLYINTEDGVTINAWYIRASPRTITILFCHGNGGNLSHRLDIIRTFIDQGYNVLIFDYRGYGRSEGKPTEKGTYLDALAAYNYLKEREDIVEERICIFGRSLGGNIAIALAAGLDKGVLISESGFTSVMDMAKHVYGVRIPSVFLSHRYDALSTIKKVEIPKLIMHGKNDRLIPFELALKLFDAAEPPKEFYAGEGGHEDIYLESGYWRRIREFIEKYLGY